MMNSPDTEEVLARVCACGLMPAVGIYQPDAAVAVARALLAGGLDVMEITFRHPDAHRCVAAIRAAVPEMLVGAGTLLSAEQIELAMKSGAQFGVTPGFNPTVVRAAVGRGFPFFPGIATPGELEQALELGILAVKVFPVEPMGGVAFLKSLSGPYQQTGMKLIPMGGISREATAAYLALPMVAAVGGSWMVPESAVVSEDWLKVTELIAEATKAVGAVRSVSPYEPPSGPDR